jgi:hypothetical protein
MESVRRFFKAPATVAYVAAAFCAATVIVILFDLIGSNDRAATFAGGFAAAIAAVIGVVLGGQVARENEFHKDQRHRAANHRALVSQISIQLTLTMDELKRLIERLRKLDTDRIASRKNTQSIPQAI